MRFKGAEAYNMVEPKEEDIFFEARGCFIIVGGLERGR